MFRIRIVVPLVLVVAVGFMAAKQLCTPNLICAKETSPVTSKLVFSTTTNHVPRQVDFVSIESAKEIAKSGPAVLFFKANWCGTCTEAQFDLNKNISTLPSNTTIITVDYDKERTLRTTYAIGTQHTWVIIDSAGNAIDTWVGGATMELQSHITSLL